MPNQGPAKLVYMHQRTGHDAPAEAIVLSASDRGIPLGWFLCFGARNVWEPDESVQDRGGATGDRNPFESAVEVSESRISQALQGLESCGRLWPFYAGMRLFERRLMARGRKGFVRLDATWAFKTEQSRHLLLSTIARLENKVNLAAADRVEGLAKLLEPAEEFCPFIPLGTSGDLKRMAKTALPGATTPAARAALLLCGYPPDRRDSYLKQAEDDYSPLFAPLENGSAYPADAPGGNSSRSGVGIFSSIKRLFGGR